MNNDLKRLLIRYLENPDDIENVQQIRALKAAEKDFDDELFESFHPGVRGKIYVGLLLWTDLMTVKKILDRRATIEKDPGCSRRLRNMIRDWPEGWHGKP